MPLQPVPFSKKIDELDVTTTYLSIDLTNFVHPIASPDEDASPHTHMKAVVTDDAHKKMDVTIHLILCGTVPTDQRLLLTAKFSVSSRQVLTTGYVGVRLMRYCFDLVKNYISKKTLTDKNGKAFELPDFNYSEKNFANMQMG